MEKEIFIYPIGNDSQNFLLARAKAKQKKNPAIADCYFNGTRFALSGYTFKEDIFESFKNEKVIFMAFRQDEKEPNKWNYFFHQNMQLIHRASLSPRERITVKALDRYRKEKK